METARSEHVLSAADVDDAVFAEVRDRELAELRRRDAAYRAGRPPVEVAGRTVVLVDDGLATGATARAALQVLTRRRPARIVVAVPVGSPAAVRELSDLADEVVCLHAPSSLGSVGRAYTHFGQTSDEEVRRVLRDAGPGL